VKKEDVEQQLPTRHRRRKPTSVLGPKPQSL
jgi:hypothetical protein